MKPQDDAASSSPVMDPGSLDRLRDIVIPEPISWWPPSVGWWVLGATLLVCVIAMLYRYYRQYRRNAYRRFALASLASATDCASISEIVKRTALVAYPREEVARLTGSEWNEWLGTHGPAAPSEVMKLLSKEFNGGNGLESERETAQTREYAARWIKSHAEPSADPSLRTNGQGGSNR